MGDCVLGKCNHVGDSHEEGSCWTITEPDLKNGAEFCPCSVDGNIRRYERLGVMIPTRIDYLMTKKCSVCRVDFLMRLNEKVCMWCKEKPTG